MHRGCVSYKFSEKSTTDFRVAYFRKDLKRNSSSWVTKMLAFVITESIVMPKTSLEREREKFQILSDKAAYNQRHLRGWETTKPCLSKISVIMLTEATCPDSIVLRTATEKKQQRLGDLYTIVSEVSWKPINSNDLCKLPIRFTSLDWLGSFSGFLVKKVVHFVSIFTALIVPPKNSDLSPSALVSIQLISNDAKFCRILRKFSSCFCQLAGSIIIVKLS